MKLRPELRGIVDGLLALDERVLDLNTIAEHIGASAVSTEDIDAIFDALEAEGRVIGDPAATPASAGLGATLTAARALKAELGRTPNVHEIAARSGLDLHAVRLALLFVKVAQR